ncbi:MAG: RuBisCO large subunit C-terminal-like domain-containing protein [Chitinispirillaceae bacterium]
MSEKEFQNSRFTVDYQLTIQDGRSAEDHARDIAVEQTVEIPYEYVPERHFRAGMIGRVEQITPVDDRGRWKVRISYRSDCTAYTIPQLFNMLYGNISLKKGIRITDIALDRQLQNAFTGPGYGIEGVRRELGIYERPLACTALKPMGLSVSELAERAEKFSFGGIDLIKDDHGITEQHFHPFEERVARCQEAVERAYAATGRKTLYFPMVAGAFDQIDKQVRYAVGQGVRGILVAPMLVGPDAVRYFSREYSLIVMAHPALTGTFFQTRDHGMSPAVLLGTLFRLIGSDISIFPNWGGRFPFTREECVELASALRREQYGWKGAFPCPAGGMNLGRVKEMGEAFGKDTVFLIGGALLDPSGDTQKLTSEFMDSLRGGFGERVELPAEFVSSCSVGPAGASVKDVKEILPFSGYRWGGREVQEYKQEGRIPFRGILRSELVGRFGENTSFDLRYFEIEPGGFSSFEKHIHEHVIIGVRGEGVLLKKNNTFKIKEHDIAYVAPLEAHQLRNDGDSPFGFFCIVDHVRDKPRQV